MAFTVHAAKTLTASSATVLFLPGWLCTANSWNPTAERLSDRMRCVTLDFPGFGAASAGGREDWSFEAFGQDVAAVIDAADLGRVVLVGHSMGGAIAIETVLASRHRVTAVVGVDSFTYPEFYDRVPEALIEPAVRPFADDFANTVRSAMQAYVLPEADAAVGAMIDEMAAADVARGCAVLRSFLRWDVAERMALLTLPVTGINSEIFTSEAALHRWRRCLDLTLIPDAGHFIMFDVPQAFDTALLDKVNSFYR